MFCIKLKKISFNIINYHQKEYDPESDYFISLLHDVTLDMWKSNNFLLLLSYEKNKEKNLLIHREFCLLLEEIPYFTSFLLKETDEGEIEFGEQGFFVDLNFIRKNENVQITMFDNDESKIIAEDLIPFDELLQQFIDLMNNFLTYAIEIYPEFTQHYYYQDWINEGSLKEFIDKYCSIDTCG